MTDRNPPPRRDALRTGAALDAMRAAEGSRRRPRLLPLALAISALVAALAGAGALVLRGGADRPADVQERVPGGAVLAPLDARRDAATGEETAPFQGFAVSVATEPAGAFVSIGGVPRGESPALAGVDCAPGEAVEIRAERAGHRPAIRSTRCRADTLVKLVLVLEPAAP